MQNASLAYELILSRTEDKINESLIVDEVNELSVEMKKTIPREK